MSRIIGLMLVAAALHGCGMVRLAYNQAPDALYWWLDSYLDFNESQTLRVRADLDALQTWHRSNELPRYADLLRRARDLAPGDVNAQQVCALFEEGRARAVAVLERLEPTVLAIAPTLDEQQLGVLEKHLEKRNRKWRSEWLEGPARKRLEHRVKQTAKRAEMLYGSLGDKQLDAVRQNMGNSSFDAATSYRETVRRQQDALKTLRALRSGPPAESTVRQDLLALFDRTVNSPDPAYRSYFDTITREGCAAVARLHNSTTQAQRAKAVRTLQDYEEDFRALAAAR